MVVMQLDNIKMTVGLQRSTNQYVQYCISIIWKKPSSRMAKLQELETALTERVVIPYAKSPLTLQIYSFFSTFKISKG